MAFQSWLLCERLHAEKNRQNGHPVGFLQVHVTARIACVASVFVGFGSKERPRNGIFGVLLARKMGREPKRTKEGGWGGKGRKRPGFRKLPFVSEQSS